MGASVGRGGRRGFRDINVTPLVDVMLVLLVVFMVTAPMMTTGLELELPKVKASSTTVKDDKLLVSVSAEGKVFFGEEEITGRVLEAFQQDERLQSERELYIRGDKNARYGTVAEVVAAARLGGVEALNLLVEPEALGPDGQDPSDSDPSDSDPSDSDPSDSDANNRKRAEKSKR